MAHSFASEARVDPVLPRLACPRYGGKGQVIIAVRTAGGLPLSPVTGIDSNPTPFRNLTVPYRRCERHRVNGVQLHPTTTKAGSDGGGGGTERVSFAFELAFEPATTISLHPPFRRNGRAFDYPPPSPARSHHRLVPRECGLLGYHRRRWLVLLRCRKLFQPIAPAKGQRRKPRRNHPRV